MTDPEGPVPPQIPWPEPEPEPYDDPRVETTVMIGEVEHTMLLEPGDAWDERYGDEAEPVEPVEEEAPSG